MEFWSIVERWRLDGKFWVFGAGCRAQSAERIAQEECFERLEFWSNGVVEHC